MEKKIWNVVAVFLLVSNTFGIIILVETLIFKKPYISIFILILFASVYFNMKIFKIENLKLK